MQEGFDLLVAQVRNAIDVVKRLRREKKALEADVSEANTRMEGLETRLREREAQRQHLSRSSGEAETLGAELAKLEQERLDASGRIGKLTELLERLDA